MIIPMIKYIISYIFLFLHQLPIGVERLVVMIVSTDTKFDPTNSGSVPKTIVLTRIPFFIQ
jgi:hypothetical protein